MIPIAFEDFDLDRVPVGTTRGTFSLDVGGEGCLPFHVERAAAPGPTVLVTAGVHAAEYTCIEAAQRLISDRPPLRRGTLVVLPVVNWKGFWQRSIFLNPADGKNLNRVFPGRSDGTESERLADRITRTFVSRARAHVDLHSGDLIERLHPFCFYDRADPASRALAEVFGMPYMAATTAKGYTVTAAAAVGCVGLIAEAGDFGTVGAAEVDLLVAGVRRVLAHLGLIESRDAVAVATRSRDVDIETVAAEVDCLWYPAVVPGNIVTAGERIGFVRLEPGAPLHERVSPRDGVVLYMMNGVPVRKGEPLLSLGCRT